MTGLRHPDLKRALIVEVSEKMCPNGHQEIVQKIRSAFVSHEIHTKAAALEMRRMLLVSQG